ncbi:MAG: KAP family NTPase [Methanosarcina barkeri]|nr:KAP family NTPase [Methanosarcina sp. ERenArc_MAG2]
MQGDKSKSSFECLNDVSTKEDVLGFRPYVEAIAEFLTAEGTRPPITLSIEGQWGCGKSSFMKQLKEKIEMGNISNIKIVTFLKYLFSKSEDKIPDELSPLISFVEFVYEKMEQRNL